MKNKINRLCKWGRKIAKKEGGGRGGVGEGGGGGGGEGRFWVKKEG